MPTETKTLDKIGTKIDDEHSQIDVDTMGQDGPWVSIDDITVGLNEKVKKLVFKLRKRGNYKSWINSSKNKLQKITNIQGIGVKNVKIFSVPDTDDTYNEEKEQLVLEAELSSR